MKKLAASFGPLLALLAQTASAAEAPPPAQTPAPPSPTPVATATPAAETPAPPAAAKPCEATAKSLKMKHLEKIEADPKGTFCPVVADAIWGKLVDARRKANKPPVTTIPLAMLNHVAPEAIGNHGSAAQAMPVASATPVTTSGAALALAGTISGPQAIASVALNPISMLADGNQLAWATRFSDVSLVLPAALTTSSNPMASNDAFSFVGVRVRVNAVASLSAGSIDRFTADLSKAAEEFSTYVTALTAYLENAPDPDACATSLLDNASDDVTRLCGGTMVPFPASTEKKLAGVLARARNEADRYYLGLDLRGDFGDPTLSDDPAKRGTFLLGAIAAGWRFGNEGSYFALRGRAGAQYAQFDQDKHVEWGVNYGGAMEVGYLRDLQRTALSVGIEGNHNSDTVNLTNFVDLKVGTTVPVTDGKQISLGLSWPLSGDHGKVLTMTGDWSLLLPQTASSASLK